MNDYATNSEAVFASLCESQGLTVTKIPENPNRKTPDFEVTNGNASIVAEVKQHESEEAKKAKKWVDDNPGEVRVGNVDFKNTGRMDRILRKQKRQLAEASQKGIPTLAVIYPEETMGPTDYACQTQLERGLLDIPSEISAVMYLENKNVQYSEATPKAQVFRNLDAKVQFPVDFF